MNIPTISKKWDTEHGHIVSGIAFDEERGVEIPFWQGTPFVAAVEDQLVAKTGLTADLKSLQLFGYVALELGVGFTTIGHKHNNAAKSIRENSLDVQYIVNHLIPKDVPLHAAGLSRGWVCMLLAGIHLPNRFSSMSAVAPAMMAPVNPFRFWRLGAEVAVETARNPREFGGVLIDSVRTVKSRFNVTVAEAAKVGIGGFVHDRVRSLRTSNAELKLHLAASKEDCFFDPNVMEQIAHELGFNTFTLLEQGSAGHQALAYDQDLNKSIVATAIEAIPDRAKFVLANQKVISISEAA